MHPDNEHLLIVGTIEDADPASLRQAGSCAKENHAAVFGAGLFETEDLTTWGFDSRQDVPDGAVLPGGVHPLEDEQQRIVIGRVVKALQGIDGLDVVLGGVPGPLLRLADGLHTRRPCSRSTVLALLKRKSFDLIFISVLRLAI